MPSQALVAIHPRGSGRVNKSTASATAAHAAYSPLAGQLPYLAVITRPERVPHMRVFKGARVNGSELVWVEQDGVPERLITATFSLTFAKRSPTGFNWGYQGSGPSQLALALLLEIEIAPYYAMMFYQRFKSRFVSSWPDTWSIAEDDLVLWIYDQPEFQQALRAEGITLEDTPTPVEIELPPVPDIGDETDH